MEEDKECVRFVGERSPRNVYDKGDGLTRRGSVVGQSEEVEEVLNRVYNGRVTPDGIRKIKFNVPAG